MAYYHLYKDTSGHWRWRYVSSNNRIISISSEGYVNKADAINSINIMRGSAGSPIRE